MSASEAPGDAPWMRERFQIIAAVAVLTALAWAYLLWLRAGMIAPSPDMPDMSVAEMAAMASPGFTPWSLPHFLFMFAMWFVMMVGMMLPTVTPMLLLYERLAQKAAISGTQFAPTAWFASGYLLAWAGFSLLATLAQYGLERLVLLTPMMESANAVFGGAVLVGVGVYQWTPLKNACLSQCRAPLSFVQRHGGFRAERPKSLRLGVLHGAYCVGCCGSLMALLFVGGVMNIFWIAGLMILVLLEKITPGGRFLARLAGVAAIAAGVFTLAGAWHLT
jgi:predicted metal-binding membrane protein